MGENKIQVDVSRAIPIFADEALVVSRIKAKKNEAGNKVDSKEGLLELIFLDSLGQQPRAISRVVMSRTTAEGLQKIISENLSKMNEELKSKKLPQPPKAHENLPQKKSEQGYLG